MRTSILLTLCLLGCFPDSAEILSRNPSEWSSRDCITVIVSSMAHNLDDQEANVQVFATPYLPNVVAAISRLRQGKEDGSLQGAHGFMDALLKSGSGVYMNWDNGRYVNAKGNYLRSASEIDSLLFLISMRNRSWPCNVPTLSFQAGGQGAMIPLARLADWPCDIPDITDIHKRIFLRTDGGETLRPSLVLGRRNNGLTTEETLLVRFALKQNGGQALEGSDHVILVLDGFQKPIHLHFRNLR